jgi:SAM domain (Sterile alpha motif)
MPVVVWLRSLGLGKYEAAFRENEIDETILPSLTHETRKELGVTAVGHRLKLFMRRGSYWKMEPAPGSKGLSCRRRQTYGFAMEITGGLIIALIMLVAQVHPATQRMQFDCTITKVVIKHAGTGTSVQHEEHLIFWIDDIEKSLVFTDGVELRITRFDQSWISGDRDGMRYEFDRSDGTLSFAGTTSDGTATTTLGSGHCESADKT